MSSPPNKPPPLPPSEQRPGGEQQEGQSLRWNQRTWVWFLLLLFLLWMAFQVWGDPTLKSSVEVSYTRLVQEIESDNVLKLREKTPRFYAELRQKIPWRPLNSELAEKQVDNVYANASPHLYAQLASICREKGLDMYVDGSADEILTLFLLNMLPILLLIGLFWFMTSRVRKQMGSGLFGRFTGNRAKRYERNAQSVTFKDVAGLKNVKRELKEIVQFLKDPERFTRLGAKIPKGVLLVGPPGTGKTLLARAVAGEAGVPFFSISGSEFIELFVGVGASRVRELFDEAKKASPCIVFIDEIDAVGRSRGTGLGGGHDEREQTLNQILSEMDGFDRHQAVIVLAATNRPDVLDQALVRPGRFDRQVVVERPQRDGRRAILEVHTRNIPLAPDVDLTALARGTIGFSGADLENLANEGALMAARRGHDRVTHDDFERAKDKIVLGILRDESMSDRDKKICAYHEAGHALIALLLPEADPVHSVTIVPRGRALGVTQQVPAEDVHNYSRTYLTNRVVTLLGGRAAEEIIFQEFTTGAENDLQQATDLVERMVCRWGMSEKLGPVAFKRGEEHVFLGRELGETKHHSEHTAMLIDDEIRTKMDTCYRQAMELLAKEKPKLVLLAEELLEKEVLADTEIYELLEFPLPPVLAPDEPEEPATVDEGAEQESVPEVNPPSEDVDPDLLGWKGV